MAEDAGVIIKADLEAEDLTRKIDKLVADVDKKFSDMAQKIDENVEKINSSLGRLSSIAQNNVTAIKQAFTQLGTTFDDFAKAMQKAAKAAGSMGSGGGSAGGSGGGRTGGTSGSYASGTVGELMQQIESAKQLLKEYQKWSPELQFAVDKLEKMKKDLKEMTTSSAKFRLDLAKTHFGNIDSFNPRTITEAEAKIARLKDLLNHFRNEMNRLGIRNRFDFLPESMWNRIQAAIDRTEKKLQKLRETASKPLPSGLPNSMTGVMGMSEGTLNEIALKMKAISQLRAQTPIGSSDIQKLNTEYARLSKLQNDVLGKNKQLIESNNSLGRAFGYIKNRLAFALSIGAITNFTRQLYEIRGQYELLERSLGVLVNSFSKGSEIFAELNAMAIKSPYTLIELGTAAKQLTAYNFEAGEVVNTTKRLADIAAALGVPMERLVYNLGQIRAQTALTARDARDFANAGLAIVPELSKYYTELEGKVVSTADVFDRMKKKAVSYNDVMAVLNKVTDEGGKFFNFQAKQAGTLRVQMANLNLAWNNMLNDIGKGNQAVLTAPITALKSLFRSWREISNVLSNVAISFGIVKLAQVAYISMVSKVGAGTALATATNWKFVNSLLAVKNAFVGLMTSPLTWWTLLATVVLSAATAFDEAQEGLRLFNKAISDGAKENVENISKFLEDYSKIRERLTNEELMKSEPVSQEEAVKTWEALKEQIELTSGASDIFINNLLSIEDVNERLRMSFGYLETIKSVSAALEKVDENTIQVQQDWSKWWNFDVGKDSFFENIQDYTSSLHYLELAYKRANGEQIEFSERFDAWSHVALGSVKEVQEIVDSTLSTVRDNLDDTYESMMKFAKNKDWFGNPDAMNEFFGQIGKNIMTQGLEKGWNEDEVFRFQLEFEEYRSKAVKQALAQRIQQEKQSYLEAQDEQTRIAIRGQIERDKAQLNAWEQNNGRGRILWREFTKWMEDEHSSQVRTMYNKLTQNGKRAIDYNSKDWKDFVDQMSKQFAKENKLSQDDTFNHLKNWVNDANKWKIFIELFIGTGEQKTIYDSLTEADKAADDAYNKIKRLGQEIDRLKAKKKGVDAVQGAFIDNDIEKTTKEQTKAQEEYNEALAKGGRSRAAEADAKKKVTASNRADAAARREQAKAESELQKALREELQVIDKAQKAYKELVKAGMSRSDALDFSTKGFDESISKINSVLKKYKIAAFDLSKYAGVSNPREILTMLEAQVNGLLASKLAKPEEIVELQARIKEVKLEAEKFDLKKITDGLNSELGKLKEEYELGVELDANPELGAIIADAFGIDMTKLPKTAQEAIDKIQDMVNSRLKDFLVTQGYDADITSIMATFDVLGRNLEEWANKIGVEMDSEIVQAFAKAQKDARDILTKDTKQTLSEWQKLLEKYAEYETKKAEIQRKAEQEREAARKHGASQEIFDAIDLKEVRELAKLDFEEFQKTAQWITATGELSHLSTNAINMLIDSIGKYKKSAKNLEPKQIKKINDALRKLRNEQRKNNPFAALAISMDEARERMEQFEPDIQDVEAKIRNLQGKEISQGYLDEKDTEKLRDLIELLKKLLNLQNEVGKVTFDDVMKGIGKYVSAIRSVTNEFSEFAKSTNNFDLKQTADAIDDVLGNIESAEKGAETWGGWWGAIIGGVTDAIPKILKWVSGNAEIDNKIQQSQLEVKKLTNFYKDLEYAAKQAYGVQAYGAQKTLILNKEFQKAELERQLTLEKSRKKKYQDANAIAELEGQIKDLELEIHESTENIVNDLLGISSKADFAENLVKSMIDAFKQGEDYMKVFEDSFEDMVDNMIMKAIVSRLVGDWINSIWDKVNAKVAQSDRVKQAERSLTEAENMLQGYEELVKSSPTNTNIQLRDMWRQKYEEALTEYNNAITPTPEDIANMREFFEQGRDDFKNNFLAYMDAFGIQFGQSTGAADLSALQQGIQGITEDTAGALEAYMNSVSQQVYLQSDLLTQIRDILINFGGDVTIATNAQILFELQQSFQVQMTIQSILQGWSNASGLAMRVELVS